MKPNALRFLLSKDPARRACVFPLLRAAIEATPDDRDYVWIREAWKKSRTNAQNATLFGWVYPPLMEHIGLRGEKDRDDLHEYFCGEYFGWTEYRLLDQQKVRPRRTTTTDEDRKRSLLTTAEFADFVDFVIGRAADQGVVIPDPIPEHIRQMEQQGRFR